MCDRMSQIIAINWLRVNIDLLLLGIGDLETLLPLVQLSGWRLLLFLSQCE